MHSTQQEKSLVFTDLDGTLLDHNNYSFDAAREMLLWIKEHEIPLIIVTSKTKSEVIKLQKRLNITAPFIIENGAGIFLPGKGSLEMVPLGKLYSETREYFLAYAKEIDMRGFGDMSVEEIAAHTGLSLESAADARERTFSEPFILENERDLEKLKNMAEKDGFSIVRGGRFFHLITKGQDKARAIKWLIEHHDKSSESRLHTVALGDSDNDITMLESVDTPILIPHPDGSFIDCDILNLIKAPAPGPAGWNDALKEYFHVQ